MPGTGLRLQGIWHTYPGRGPALKGVGLEVPAGTSLALLGPNGSGKTTLLRIAAGLRAPQAGRAELSDGVPVALAGRRGRIGYIPQHLGLVRHATALQNACLGGAAAMPWWRTLVASPPAALRLRATEALAAVGLAAHADTLVRELSGGERQRVAVARTMVQEPDVLVADELVASLDSRQARQVLALLDGFKERGCTVVASMHNVEAALRWADAVAVLAEGRLQGPRKASELTLEDLPWHAVV